MARLGVLALLVCAGLATATVQREMTAANPIRKVVTLLQAMQKKVTDEGEAAKGLYEKYMCWCKNGKGALSASIAGAETKIGQVGSAIEAKTSELAQLKEALKQDQADRAAAKAAMAEATELREKQAATYAGVKAEDDANIAALRKAVAALEKGAAGGFLQTNAAQAVLKIVRAKDDMDDADRQDLVSFLSGSSSYAPQSGQIIGILKQLGDEMTGHLADATATEEAAIKSYDQLMADKKKEVEALSAAIEDKLARIGKLGVLLAQMKNDLGDTQEALMADKKFLADMDKNCATREKEWAAEQAVRAEELVALADTIKVLNDDDALELFKKTLPSAASFVQLRVGVDARRAQALRILSAVAPRSQIDLISLALRGKKIGFDKVIKMIDAMVATLKQEQLDDDDKKEYCGAQLDTADDGKKSLERAVAQAEAAIATAKDGIQTATDEIKALNAAIKSLDDSVAAATEQRKNEQVAFNDLIASDSAAKELLGFAKNRLNKFYNPKLYVAPPKRELSEEDRINVAMGGTAPATAAPGGIAGTGISFAQNSVAPPPAPKQATYAKSTAEGTGVIAMIDLLVKDLDKEMTEAKTDEADAQADYEQAMKDAAKERADNTASLNDKMAVKADTEAELQKQQDAHAASASELAATLEYIHSLHGECDWLLQYFDVRKEARASEVDSLEKAKAVLNGADYSLMQVKTHGFLSRA